MNNSHQYPRTRISTGSPFEQQAGYSRAIRQGPWCFVSGTTGYDYASMTMPQDFEAQARNAFATIGSALNQAGMGMGDVVRARYMITDRVNKDAFYRIAGEHFGHIRPAATLIICDLAEPEMLVEIEVTAFTENVQQEYYG